MAKIKSNIKTKKQSDKKHAANSNKIASLKTTVKENKDLNKIYQKADSLSRKHVIHRNKANRIKSRRAKAMNKAKAAAK